MTAQQKKVAIWIVCALGVAGVILAWWWLAELFQMVLWENRDNPEDRTPVRLWRDRIMWTEFSTGACILLGALLAAWMERWRAALILVGITVVLFGAWFLTAAEID